MNRKLILEYTPLFFLVLGTILTLTANILEHTKEKNTESTTAIFNSNVQKKKKKSVILFWFGIIGVIIAFLSSLVQFISQKETEAKNDKLTEEGRVNDSIIRRLSLLNLDRAEKILKTQSRLTDKLIDIRNFQVEALNDITGGNTKPYLAIQLSTSNGPTFSNHFLTFYISNNSNYNLKDLRVKIFNPYSSIGRLIYSDINKNLTFKPKEDTNGLATWNLEATLSFGLCTTQYDVGNLAKGESKKIAFQEIYPSYVAHF